jgi:hypothetical protein
MNDMAGRERARKMVMDDDMRTDRESGPCPIPETNFFGFNLSDWHSFVIPFWFLTTLTVSVAVAPWIHWSNRFSLSTLLIATTLIAVGLGVLVELAAPTS